MKMIAIIPARGGSKGVPKKNIALLGGYPLIAYSIVAAKLSSQIERVIVSTDSKEIAEIALKFGAEVPFLRPSEFAQDHSTDAEFFLHAIAWLREHEGVVAEMMVFLRPTTPFRNPADIDRAISYLQQHPDASALKSLHELAEPPHKMFQLNSQGYLEGFFPDDPRPEYYNLPRQIFPKAYKPNGAVDIIKPAEFLRTQLLYGPKILGFVTPLILEVDTPDDFDRLGYVLNKEGHILYQYLKEHFPLRRRPVDAKLS